MAHRPVTVAYGKQERRRKLHRGHFAFLRGVVQGVSMREMWNRYVAVEGSADDPRAVQVTLRWLRTELAIVARRASRHGVARLIQIQFDRPAVAGARDGLPTLEQFVRQKHLGGFSESEQLAAYEEAFGGQTQRERRIERLINRQLDALFWLEKLAAEIPRADDLPQAWFPPALAGHLERAGIDTLRALVERINGIGRNWARAIRAIGPTKGARILEWLREHEEGLGLSIGRHVTMQRSHVLRHELEALVPPDTAVRPLEKLIVPAALDGSRGKYRRPQADCLLEATNDYEAIVAWIRSKRGPQSGAGEGTRPGAGAATPAGNFARTDTGHNGQPIDAGQASLLPPGPARLGTLSGTQRAYRKEAERFLLWAIIERKKPLSSMTQEDCVAYREFLANPQPSARWCSRTSAERWSPMWRPFRGPLSPSAQRQAVVILGNLYAFLVSQNYLMGNPWMAVTVPAAPAPKLDPGRSFSFEQWRFIDRELAALPDTARNRRLQLAIRWLYATGLRLSEMVAARVDDLVWVEYPADADHDEPIAGWWLRVIGKGRKLREVPVPDALVEELRRTMKSRGLPVDFNAEVNRIALILGKVADDEDGPIGHLRRGDQSFSPEQGIATSTLYKDVKAFFRKCADQLRASHRKGADRLLLASTHWLRHAHASHSIARGTPIEVAQQNLGHASLATTTVYVTTEKKRRLQAMRKFWGSPG